MDLKDLLTNKWTYIIGIIVILAVIGGINDCSDSKKREAKSADAYITAVAENDYTQAHLILNKLQADYLQYPDNKSKSETFWNAANYIYKAEMQYLLPQNDREADRRLLYTLDDFTPIGVSPEADYEYSGSEYYDNNKKFEAYMRYASGYNKLCLEMIRVALRNNNLEFAKEVLSSMKDNFHQNTEKDEKNTYTYTYTLNEQAQNEAKKLIQDYENRHLN
ncbi:MAG: hypothetical protein J1F16_08065 [Muribaculaceae bacterium]|nr:hypothetical protein [Muribaculaceae bacterium]